MKITGWFTLMIVAASIGSVQAIPSQITYQGTLKESGVPASGPRTMVFRLTDASGSAVYWSSGNMTLTVNQGLFSTTLSPTGVSWETITPYMEVSVQGQILLPREPVSASVYSLVAGSIVDGAVSPSKLDPTVQDRLLPSGMIAMFAGPCPSGWSPYANLENRFPMGGATAGVTGGSASHSHTISMQPAHDHGGTSGGPSKIQGGYVFASPQGGGSFGGDWGSSIHTHAISADGAHDHGGQTGDASTLPPYYTVLYCQKN